MRSWVGTFGFLLAIAMIYTAADAQNVVISASDCANLVRHVADADVAYQPGVDVDGGKVAPADLGPTAAMAAPRTLTIPITVDLNRRLGIPPDSDQYQTQNFTVGTVEWKDGAAWFNGQPLQNEESRKLAELCQRRLARKR